MPKLPVVSGIRASKVFHRCGYVFDHQTGSHMILYRKTPASRLTIPKHKELSKGVLRTLITQAGLTKNEFISLLEKT